MPEVRLLGTDGVGWLSRLSRRLEGHRRQPRARLADPFASLNKACVMTFGSTVSYRQGTAAPFAVRGIPMKDSDEEQHREGRYARCS